MRRSRPRSDSGPDAAIVPDPTRLATGPLSLIRYAIARMYDLLRCGRTLPRLWTVNNLRPSRSLSDVVIAGCPVAVLLLQLSRRTVRFNTMEPERGVSVKVYCYRPHRRAPHTAGKLNLRARRKAPATFGRKLRGYVPEQQKTFGTHWSRPA